MNYMIEKASVWHLDLDHYLNRIVPPSPLHRLPPFLSRFLGYRKEPKEDVGNILQAWWSCVGAFCGLAMIFAVFNNSHAILAHNPPTYIASFGASAVLEYNAIRSPLGQPRNAILGHTFSALVGVALTKLFQYHSEYERIKWIAGALACGVSSAIMLLTGTVHPPGGASAVLAATEPAITAMGWYFVGLVMAGTSLMVIVGLIINNIQRQFPVYWWTPVDIRKLRAGRRRKGDPEDIPNSQPELEKRVTEEQMDYEKRPDVLITAAGIEVPDDLHLTLEEDEALQSIRQKLRSRFDVAPSEDFSIKKGKSLGSDTSSSGM